MSMRTSSWTKSGLPSEVGRIRSRSAPASGAAPSCQAMSSSAACTPSGWSRSALAFARGLTSDGRRSSSSGRAVQTSRSGTPRVHAPRYSMRSSSVSSAQCTSSTTAMTGRRRASASKSLRMAQNVSSTGMGGPGRPSAGPIRSRISAAPASASSSAATSPLAMSCDALSARPAAWRTASAIGAKVMPSPYGRQWPVRICASRWTCSASSPISRVLPVPAGATTRGDADVALLTGAPPELEQLRELALPPDQRRMQIPPDSGRAGEHRRRDATPARAVPSP